MNLPSIIILTIVIVIVVIDLYVLFKNKGNTCSCCKNDNCPSKNLGKKCDKKRI